jgi:hypothetical protein
MKQFSSIEKLDRSVPCRNHHPNIPVSRAGGAREDVPLCVSVCLALIHRRHCAQH